MFNDPQSPQNPQNAQDPQNAQSVPTPLTPSTHSFQPFPTEPTQPPIPLTPVEIPKKSKKKWFIIAGIVLLVALLITGAVWTKTTADVATKNYAKAIDTHLDAILKESSREKRLALIDQKATLQPVFLGAILSGSYKNASKDLTPFYDQTIAKVQSATKVAVEYNAVLTDFIGLLQKAAATGIANDFRNKEDFTSEDMATVLETDFKVADQLNAAADNLENATPLKQYPSYAMTLIKTREWAAVRRENGAFVAVWIEDMLDNAGAILQEATTYKKNNPTPPLDTATYVAQKQILTDKYIAVSNEAMDYIEKLADEAVAGGFSDEIKAQLNEATKQVEALNKKLEQFVPASELSQ